MQVSNASATLSNGSRQAKRERVVYRRPLCQAPVCEGSAEALTLRDLQGVDAESISERDVAPGVVVVFHADAAIEENVFVR